MFLHLRDRPIHNLLDDQNILGSSRRPVPTPRGSKGWPPPSLCHSKQSVARPLLGSPHSKSHPSQSITLGGIMHQRLIDYLLFYVPLKNFSLIWKRHHYRWRTAKFWPMLSSQSLWVGRDLYHATPAVTRGLVFSGLIRRTTPFSHLLRHTRGCGEPILTRILMGLCTREICCW
jgi:hypothetical protein